MSLAAPKVKRLCRTHKKRLYAYLCKAIPGITAHAGPADNPDCTPPESTENVLKVSFQRKTKSKRARTCVTSRNRGRELNSRTRLIAISARGGGGGARARYATTSGHTLSPTYLCVARLFFSSLSLSLFTTHLSRPEDTSCVVLRLVSLCSTTTTTARMTVMTPE